MRENREKLMRLTGQLLSALERAEAETQRLQRECDAKQSQIDSLMLEHCPDEFTQERRFAWANEASD